MKIKDVIVNIAPHGLVKAYYKDRKEEERIRKLNDSLPAKSWKTKYSVYHESEPVEDNWVLYESHCGAGMLCNPLAIFKAFARRKDFTDFLHIWVIRDEDELLLLRDEYKNHKNVYFVYYNSRAYAYYLAKSKYLINNTSFTSPFSKRDEQVFVNTWHSITVKSLGYDTPDGNRVVKNMLRNFLVSDYLISPNKFMTKIYNDSFRLKNVFEGKYIEEGYPRNDLTVNTERSEIVAKLERRGTKIDPNKKIILYAPTWTGNNANKADVDLTRYYKIKEHFEKTVDMNKYQLLIKPHHVEYRTLNDTERESGMYVSSAIDANELLAIVDILITDYSSIYFDYLVADRPILFYIPDYEKYQNIRGIYFTLDELPGPCSYTLDELSDNINSIDTVEEKFAEKRRDTRAWACERDNGKVSEKILDIVIDKNLNYNLLSADRDGKKKLLFYAGGLQVNGVTSAALSMFKSIDYNKYDVTLLVLSLKTKNQNDNFDKLPPEIRTMVRCGGMKLNRLQKEVYRETLRNAFAVPDDMKPMQKYLMKREYIRCFGKTKFDYLVDFGGYGPYFTCVTTLGGNNADAKHYIWQHSDMMRDFSNTKKMALNKNKITLEGMLSLYPHVDKIVSSTESVCEINRRNLATPETADKFTYATNLMDKDHITECLNAEEFVSLDNYIAVSEDVSDNGVGSVKMIPFDKNRKCVRFVTMGRCMPEKNQSNIVRALKKLVASGVDAVLYIIGDGHYKEHIERVAAKAGVSDRVIITGMVDNPFAILKRCDCFVFPSLYEAQGLSVLEARVVKLPIIVNNYEAVSSVMLDDKQYLLKGTKPDDILAGMKAYLNGEISSDYNFDVEEYNRKGIEDLDRLFN